MQCAIRVGNIDCLRLLTEETQMQWDDRNSDGDTVFMEAVKSQDRELIRVLLACSAVDINAASERTPSDPSSNSPIIWCLRNKKYQIAMDIVKNERFEFAVRCGPTRSEDLTEHKTYTHQNKSIGKCAAKGWGASRLYCITNTCHVNGG